MLKPRSQLRQFFFLVLAGLTLGASCSTPHTQQQVAIQEAGPVTDPVLGTGDSGTSCTIPAMMELWHHRSNTPHDDYPIGPGDELTVSVPEIEELQNQHARISQQGTVSLPLIGTAEVGGLDEDQARALISRQLAKYMKEPRVELYVERDRSRGVAVSGAVQKPGLYDLASYGDSLNDIIAMAGGVTSSAAQTVIFLPAGLSVESSDEGGTIVPIPQDQGAEVNNGRLARRISIAVPFGRDGELGCMNMPARPGDVIRVPLAGTVTVVGWVRNPGSFPIGPGMTVLGAVTAAGGAEFTWHAEVLRTNNTGLRVVKRFSLNDLESGLETDIPVEAGDVVRLEKSAVGAVPYGLSEIFKKFGAGIGMGLPAI
jgi:polysaccharide export outer membrane protein